MTITVSKLRLTTLVLALAATSVPLTTLAGSDSGFYLGGSVGSAQIDYSDNDPDIGAIDFDDDDTGYKVFGGYNMGLMPLLDLGAELSYVDFGSHKGDIGIISGSKLDVDAWTLTALLGLNLGPVGLFAKAGIVDWDARVKAPSVGSAKESDTDPVYGIGAKFQLGSFALRAEYELFDIDDVDIDYFSVGAAFTF